MSSESLGTHHAEAGLPPDWSDDPNQRVDLNLPARPELWRVARMTVSAIGSLLSFDVEQIADLRMAVDELLAICARGASEDALLSIVTRWDDDRVLVSCVAAPVSHDGTGPADGVEQALLPPGLSAAELAERILEALADSYAIDDSDKGSRSGWLYKSR